MSAWKITDIDNSNIRRELTKLMARLSKKANKKEKERIEEENKPVSPPPACTSMTWACGQVLLILAFKSFELTLLVRSAEPRYSYL